jgi:tryptophan 2,3-dioxygenase
VKIATANHDAPPRADRPGSTRNEYRNENEYADYAQINTLLTLQRPRTGEPAELSFLVVTQIMELYFTLLRRDWKLAREAMAADRPREAITALRRGHGTQEALIGAWEALRTLTPPQFDAFRESFGVASGIQSYQYRHAEFLLGARHPQALAVHDRTPAIQAELRAQAESPSLYDAALGLLRRQGLGVPDELVERDFGVQYEGDDRAVEAWREVYHGADRDLAGHGHSSNEHSLNEHGLNGRSLNVHCLADLADALFDTAERHLRWKQRHLLAVWRSMGDKPGSAGTSGAQWLERGVHRKYFPDLWTLRDSGW